MANKHGFSKISDRGNVSLVDAAWISKLVVLDGFLLLPGVGCCSCISAEGGSNRIDLTTEGNFQGFSTSVLLKVLLCPEAEKGTYKCECRTQDQPEEFLPPWLHSKDLR